MRLSLLCAAAAAAVLGTVAGVAEAGTVYLGSGTDAGGYTISASVDVTFDSIGNTVTLVLTNTTPTTFCAQELLTAFRFGFSGVTGTGTITSATGYARDVYDNGTFSDSVSVVNLLGPPASWELGTYGSLFNLKFTPDAEYALLGKAEADGDYSTANGSIKGSPGHNPFARTTATFVLSFTDVTGSASINNLNFRFGTDFAGSVTSTVTVVPLPPAVLLGLGLMGGIGAVRALRRRRRSEF